MKYILNNGDLTSRTIHNIVVIFQLNLFFLLSAIIFYFLVPIDYDFEPLEEPLVTTALLVTCFYLLAIPFAFKFLNVLHFISEFKKYFKFKFDFDFYLLEFEGKYLDREYSIRISRRDGGIQLQEIFVKSVFIVVEKKKQIEVSKEEMKMMSVQGNRNENTISFLFHYYFPNQLSGRILEKIQDINDYLEYKEREFESKL